LAEIPLTNEFPFPKEKLFSVRKKNFLISDRSNYRKFIAGIYSLRTPNTRDIVVSGEEWNAILNAMEC
jgi:hypothetical protein